MKKRKFDCQLQIVSRLKVRTNIFELKIHILSPKLFPHLRERTLSVPEYIPLCLYFGIGFANLWGTIGEQGIINNKSCSSSWLDFQGKVGEQGIKRLLCPEQLAFLTRLELETAALLETLTFTTQVEL